MMPRNLIPYVLCGMVVLFIFAAMLWPGLRKPLIAPFEVLSEAMEQETSHNKQRLAGDVK